MPEAEMAKAQQFTEGCDLMIVLGSSLTVYPLQAFRNTKDSSVHHW